MRKFHNMSLQLDYPLFFGLALFIIVILSMVFYLGKISDDHKHKEWIETLNVECRSKGRLDFL